jgi:glyoxylase-like metal-dependent hydrolase (beta-lactamase superfamily II)
VSQSLAETDFRKGSQPVEFELKCSNLGVTRLHQFEIASQRHNADSVCVCVIRDHIGSVAEELILDQETVDHAVARRRFHRLDGTPTPHWSIGGSGSGSRRSRDTVHPMTENTLHWSNADVEVHKVVVGPYENNVFVVRCRATGDAVLLDAANEHEQLLELCQRLGVKRVLETHGHWDHIQAVPAMREAGYEVAVTSLDAPMLKDVGYDVFIDDAEVIEVGRLRLHAIHNPGHTPGSISFALEGTPLLFTGDTLFPGGPGNTSFENADFDTIITSITSKLFTFPDETIVLPGHGLDTTIGTERPHLDEWIERGW